jgi:hypothetical protein
VSAADRLKEIEAMLAERNPELLAAADEVDPTLIDWSLSLSPWDRLRACSRATRALLGWRRVTPDQR